MSLPSVNEATSRYQQCLGSGGDCSRTLAEKVVTSECFKFAFAKSRLARV